MKNNMGVVLLSHCGFSFLEDLIEALKSRGLKTFVLSSLPLPEHYPQRLEEISNKVDVLSSTHAHELNEDDVSNFMCRLEQEGYHVLCCITVWEGYRHLMASVNQLLGVCDTDPQDIMALRNKLTLRNRLANAGLSHIRALKLGPDLLDELKNSDVRYFIKPIYGIASYGAFALHGDVNWETIENIIASAQKDSVYASAFNGTPAFLAEEYIHGQEYCFEVLLADNQMFTVAIHEKCEVIESAKTVLESCCTSPPASLSQQQCAEGIRWIKQLTEHLALRWGCFHIEAKFDGARWDLIEVNPRVGGSLISHSVQAMTQGKSMLELWLELLLCQRSPEQQHHFSKELQALSYAPDGKPPGTVATFFRVYFASCGLIESITLNALPLAPCVSHILLKPGDNVESDAREVFLGQLLWQFSQEDRQSTLETLFEVSREAIDIRYATPRVQEHSPR